jgi:3-phenylpropionate/trans-cinnamate dioxygenase ferredoxin reductase subunit
MSTQTFVIVGASLAGAKAAEELRAKGFDGRVLLIGSETERPYERPPLTKDYLRGESERETTYVHEEGFYAEHEIELVLDTTVTAIDVHAVRVTLATGSELRYDRLLFATGAAPRRIAIAGAELEGIHYLRTLADCDVLRERLVPGAHVAIVGAGWIGSEFAASARQAGLDVTLVDPQAVPNERIFGVEVGGFYRDLHRSHGVELRLGTGVKAFEGDGAVSRVRTTTGDPIDCDLAVVGIGAEPRVDLARDAGLNVDNGIIVSDRLESSAPDIFAAGDVARAWSPFFQTGIRVEHWANALHQGPAAARAMLGERTSDDELPYFFSDQYNAGMEYSGYAPSWDEVVLRGDPAAGEFMAFWMLDGRIAAGMNVNVWDVNEHVQALIRSRATIDVRALADRGTPLESLISETTTTERSA